ncbi:FkbM family methyltransferase [Novosphingobium humi]|uniref:Methyltransferase FkbM domain-containing protein n=1 Tax=Novosphingobium humi TaxID=2282397 RepID=A0ABY7TWL9_9SPHN|nr:FkbM family methyltransferase [Novosphingobium humi]WCT77378.1 hypothetical protein PQ457_15915 [Novosphingobium humi]
MFIDQSLEGHMAAKSTLRVLRPKKLIGSNAIRIGRNFDGGYVMIDHFSGIDAAYSLGINDDVSWDLDIVKHGIPIYQYDPTIAALPVEHPLFHWEPVWIGGVEKAEENVQTLENLIIRNGHQDKNNMLLKCDIEGAEWPVLQNIPNEILRKFSQMVFEIHDINMISQPEKMEGVRNALYNLTASHHIVHVHGNNYGGWTVIGGIPLPNVIEVTLLRKDMGEFVDSEETFPTELDMPCDRTRCDMHLGRFVF